MGSWTTNGGDLIVFILAASILSTLNVIIMMMIIIIIKATGRKKTRLDIQNYGCNGNLLCYHGVVERNRISSLQSHGKALEQECCPPGVFCDSGDTPARLLLLLFLSPPAQSRRQENYRLDIQNYGCNGNLLCYHIIIIIF